MQGHVGSVAVETIAAETPKFTAPMVCIHGLWCTAAVWRRFTGFCAHRGWTCIAVNLRGRGGGAAGGIAAVRFADYLDDVRQVLARCEAPPVVVGHDLGALLALHCDAPAVRAIVALAPLLPYADAGGSNRALTRLRARWATWRGVSLPPPRGVLGMAYLGAALAAAVPDSGRVAGELRRLEPMAAPHVPTLLVAGRRDVFSPPALVERFAQAIGASLRVAENAGHAMPWEPGWEQRVSEIHRWLVQTLGDSLLIEHEEED
jgi:pimeloyl-ACP methyl ester carboxylesterase